jgi:hypothetical protein
MVKFNKLPLDAYMRNRASVHELALEASPIVPLLRALVHGRAESWQDTAGELLEVLAKYADETTRKQRGWPTTPRGLAGTLRRLAPNLRETNLGGGVLKGARPDQAADDHRLRNL